MYKNILKEIIIHSICLCAHPLGILLGINTTKDDNLSVEIIVVADTVAFDAVINSNSAVSHNPVIRFNSVLFNEGDG